MLGYAHSELSTLLYGVMQVTTLTVQSNDIYRQTRLVFLLVSFHDLSDFDQHNPFHIDSSHEMSLSTDTFTVQTVSSARDATG